jgi:hypothetical protein
VGGMGAPHSAASNGRSASALFGFLQDNDLAPPSAGEVANKAIVRAFKELSDKEAKKAAKITSYKDFAERVRTSKCMSRAALESDPEAYWQMHWLFFTVHYLFTTHGWGVAGVYYTLVMKRWEEGFLNVQALVDTEEFRRGDYGASLDQRAFVVAIQKGAPTGAGLTSGTKTRQNASDTYCAKCKLYFPKFKMHETSNCRQ